MVKLASGIFCLGPSTLASIALILSLIANSRCEFADLDASNLGFTGFPSPVKSVGLWCYTNRNGDYVDIRDVDVDSKFEAARGLGTTVMVFGWTIWVFYLLASCKRFGPKVFMFVGLLCILNTLFQGLVFLIFKSVVCTFGCSPGTHGKCAISAIVFWFLAGLTSFGAGKELEEAEAEATEGDE